MSCEFVRRGHHCDTAKTLTTKGLRLPYTFVKTVRIPTDLHVHGEIIQHVSLIKFPHTSL